EYGAAYRNPLIADVRTGRRTGAVQSDLSIDTIYPQAILQNGYRATVIYGHHYRIHTAATVDRIEHHEVIGTRQANLRPKRMTSGKDTSLWSGPVIDDIRRRRGYTRQDRRLFITIELSRVAGISRRIFRFV